MKISLDTGRIKNKLHYMRVAATRRSRIVSKAMTERKARFRAALVIAGMTAREWAIAEKITPTYLSSFLAGRYSSQRLEDKIDAFAEKYDRSVA